MKPTYYEVKKMTNKIVIAELTKGTVNASTAELVSAAQPWEETSRSSFHARMLHGRCCPGYDGVSKVIAVKSDVFAGNDSSGWASALDSAMPAGPFFSSQLLEAKT